MKKEGAPLEEQEKGAPVANERVGFLEQAKTDTFDEMYQKIKPLVDGGKYAAAEQEINKEIKTLAKFIGGPINDVMYKLKKEFEETMLTPEIVERLNPESSEAKAKRIKRRNDGTDAVQRHRKDIGKESTSLKDTPLSMREVFDGDTAPEAIRRRTWEIPESHELRPGLILEMEIDGSGKQVFEVLSAEQQGNNKGHYIKLQNMATGTTLNGYLADMGLEPYIDKQGEFWTSRVRPVRWYRKEQGPNG